MAQQPLNIQSTSFYPVSRLDVALVDGNARYPAQISFLSEGVLLSEQVFQSQGGSVDVQVIAKLHKVGDATLPPKGHGKLTNFPTNSRLLIYELD
jgi:hypothetical protein